jgi:carbon-monoxide dehydrogenase medium subunit
VVTDFDLIEPKTLAEALALLADADTDVRAAAGCTALMLMMKAAVFRPSRLVSLRLLAPGMSAIETRSGELHIGALATLAALERSAAVHSAAPVLSHALRSLANVRVRNVATLGGSLAHADPHMDLPPVLIALGAEVTIANRTGTRVIPVEELITGYLQTTLAGGELITAARIPSQVGRKAAYIKVTARSADDWPTLGVAVALDSAGARIRSARVVLSAAVDRPTRLGSVEGFLQGAEVSEATLARAGELAAAEALPLTDQHGSAAYKSQLVRVYVRRALEQVLGQPAIGACA